MSRKFVRNITNTKIKGDKKEPLYSNVQNDILSDGEDVAIRNKNEYHILTDNIKELIAGNEFITIERTSKNVITIYGSDVDLSEYAKKEYVNEKIDEIDLSDYLKKDEAENLYTKQDEFNETINDILGDLQNYATINYVDEQIQNIDIDLTNYATKQYVDDEINNIDIPDVSNFVTENEVDDKLVNYVKDDELNDYATKSYVHDEIENIDLSNFVDNKTVYFIDGKLTTNPPFEKVNNRWRWVGGTEAYVPKIIKGELVTDYGYMFSNKNVNKVTFEDSSEVTLTRNMFYNCQATELELINFNTESVTSMSNMFNNCQATEIDLSSFNTESVTNMAGMFYNCQTTELDLSSFNTESVTIMNDMFKDCQATTGYARNQNEADKFNDNITGIPPTLVFTVKD